MAELISQAEFARRMGFTAPNVSIHVKKGNITLKDGKVPWPEAKNELQGNVSKFKQQAEQEKAVTEGISENNSMNFARVKAVHESLKARKVKLELEQMEGSLVDAKAVKESAFKQARLVRDTLLAVPQRLAPVIANESNEHRVHELIHDEIVSVLRTLDGNKSLRIIR